MTVGGDDRAASEWRSVTLPVEPETVDPQAALLVELIEVVAEEEPSVQRILDLICPVLREAAGLEFATVYSFERERDPVMLSSSGATVTEADRSLATEVYRSGRTRAVVTADRMAVPLRRGGRTLGVLLLAGHRLAALRPEVVRGVAVHLASTLQALSDDRDRRSVAVAVRAVRRLFEEGMAASSVETAGEILARVTAEAFRTERAGMQFVDAQGVIRHTVGVGVSAELSEAIAGSLVGRTARDSPVWRRAELESGPVLVDETDQAAVRTGGFVQTLQLRSYVAMPLLSATGLVGMALCGDATRSRTWSAWDRELAGQLALQGGLVVDSARLRQAERARMAELAHQAFHDSLTGLPNRSLLLDRVEETITAAAGRRERIALLLIDLDGFKQVNDTLGHHAGDVLLQRVAERLLHAVRAPHTLARLGGDEFAVLIADDPDVPTAAAVAEEIHDQLTEPFRIEGQRVRIGASIGIALFPEHASDLSGLLRRADTAMYQAKRHRGGFRVATAA